jgi:hypothetical protein
MSLARLAVRICTVLALRAGQTMAEDRVQDSSIVDLEEGIINAPKPVILVYTDNSEFAPTGRDIWGGQGSTTLVLLLAIAGATKLQDGSVEFSFPATDASIELALDVMERQIQKILTDPDNVWAQRWRGIVTNVSKWSSKRGGSTKEGSRFGARQILIELETVHDPVPGKAPEGEWAALLQLINSDGASADTKALGAPLAALIEGDELPEWNRTMRQFGIDRAALKAMGLAPAILAIKGLAPADDDAAEIVDVSINGISSAGSEALEPEADE